MSQRCGNDTVAVGEVEKRVSWQTKPYKIEINKNFHPLRLRSIAFKGLYKQPACLAAARSGEWAASRLGTKRR